MAAVTNEEAKVLIEFRKRLSDVLKSKEQNEDMYLIRWLRGRDLNLNKAEDMLRKSIAWRQANNIDRILDVKFDSFFMDEYPISVVGQDTAGNLVVTCKIGRWDFRQVVSQGKTEEFKLYITYIFETVMERIRKINVDRGAELLPITQMTVVGDWNGYSYMQLVNIKAVQQILMIASVFEAHYPEILSRCFFINCPSFFNILLSLLKPILAPKTLGKMFSYGYNKSDWEPALLEVISPEQLPAVLESLNL